MDRINQESKTTIEGVKLQYTTGTNRTEWLKERIGAIDARVNFIRGRVLDLLGYIQSINGDTAVTLEKAFTAALGLLPGIGSVITAIEGGAQASRNLEAYKAQSLIQQYTEDIKQLAAIRNALATEYGKAGTTTPTPLQPTQEAPNPNAIYYWIGGAIVLLAFIYWMSKRRNRR
ncbi:hypothetical protein GCM10027190_38520 [Spirosoma areae]